MTANSNRRWQLTRLLAATGWLLATATYAAAADPLTLPRAVSLAQQHDPWLAGSRYAEQALQASAQAAASLPDPQISVALANLPVDTFDFDQEAMTQFSVGVTQMFPRGDSRSLQQQQFNLRSQREPHLRQERLAQVALTVTELWLDLYQAQQSIALVNANKPLFEQLSSAAETSYAAALGGGGQQALVQAQLELTLLEDRLTVLAQQREVATQRLVEWLHKGPDNDTGQNFLAAGDIQLAATLPEAQLVRPELLTAPVDNTVLAQYLQQHPLLQAQHSAVQADSAGVALVEQQYKPEWGVTASYGYRDDDPMGNSRADFFSIGVKVAVPLFSVHRQDQQVQAANAQLAKTRTERWLLLRNMVAQAAAAQAQLQGLQQRHRLYQQRLLTDVERQAEAALAAYQADRGSFAEVVRTRISQLNAGIDALTIAVNRAKAVAKLNYFLAGVPPATDGEQP